MKKIFTFIAVITVTCAVVSCSENEPVVTSFVVGDKYEYMGTRGEIYFVSPMGGHVTYRYVDMLGEIHDIAVNSDNYKQLKLIGLER